MDRRQTRLRREYLYRKSLEATEKSIHERKARIREAIQAGRPIPSDLRKDAASLKKDAFMDDGAAGPTTHIDDEYANAGVSDPKILVTTSRDPSSRLQQFAKEVRLLFPNAQRINRGGYVMKEICDACRANEVTDLIFPHLIFENFNSKLGARFQNILKYLFPVPKDESRRVMTFANDKDFISFRHHVFYKSGKDVTLAEVGPRFEMRGYEIKLGTIEDEATADTEWVNRPYSNAARKGKLML